MEIYVLKSVKYYNDFKTYTKYVTMYMILDFSKLHMYACSSKHFLNEIESFCPIYSVIRKKSLKKKLSQNIIFRRTSKDFIRLNTPSGTLYYAAL